MIATIVLTILMSSQSQAGPACRVPALGAFAFYSGACQVTLGARYRRAASHVAPDASATAERVTITTPDGAVLVGKYHDAGRGAPAVIFFPMCRADAVDGWAPIAERLRAARVSSLSIAYRGTGGSTNGPASGDQRPADVDTVTAYMRSRAGAGVPLAVAGGSCGVYMSLLTASRHADIRAVVALSGPHVDAQIEHVRRTPGLAVFSGASEGEPPSPDWARALKAASANPASRVMIREGRAHGTEMFVGNPTIAADVAAWLAQQLTATAAR